MMERFLIGLATSASGPISYTWWVIQREEQPVLIPDRFHIVQVPPFLVRVS